MLHSELSVMNGATWPARAALLALLVASLTLFWLRLRKVLRIIRGSRPTPGFTLAPIGPRIRQFLAEVLGQSKVIDQRRLPGLAHAFVFWGFCAFSLITVNHIAAGFGARFLYPNAGFGEYYYTFVAAWAVLVAVAIVGLFIRRFMVRPVWLGKTSPESGVIALLIFALMVTFLGGLVAELRLWWFDENSAAGAAIWWSQTMWW